MTPEEAIQVADEVLIAHVGNPLTDIQRMILHESLAGKGYESMKGYVSQHIKNEGKKLWDLLSKALGEKVSKTSFKGALEKRWKLGELIPKPPLLSIYNPQTWAGRKATIDECLPRLQGQVRVLWITGISGIGKTALGECLASETQNPDVSFHRISFEIEGQSKDFTEGAAAIWAELGEKELDSQERNDPEKSSDRLFKQLQAHPYWIQLDALERLLTDDSSTEFADPYWLGFLQRCLSSSQFRSRLVLTAQALPTALARFKDDYKQQWHEITLRGLSGEGEDSEHLTFFTQNGLTRTESNDHILRRIGQIYEGHPLVLQVVAGEISADFDGDVVKYWGEYGDEFEQITRGLQSQRVNPGNYSQELQGRVRDRIETSLKRLPSNSLALLCRSAVYRRPVPRAFWLAMIEDCSQSQQGKAYGVLYKRALVEQEDTLQKSKLIRQHNLICDVSYDLLKQDDSTWETAERQAADQWLTAYQPAPDTPNLEKVRGYLEAFYHFCEVEDWEAATKILFEQRWSSTNHLLGDLRGNKVPNISTNPQEGEYHSPLPGICGRGEWHSPSEINQNGYFINLQIPSQEGKGHLLANQGAIQVENEQY